MNATQLLDEILGHIRLIKDDKDKLELLLEFIQDKLVSDEKEELDEIPPAFEKVLKPIADAIDGGMVCFLNMDTLETENVHRDWLHEDFDPEIDCGIPNDKWKPFNHPQWENCLEFEPLESHESFRIMEDFASQLKNNPLQNKLILALNNRKPFANFKNIIDNSGEFRQQWFDFKQKQLEKHVKVLLEIKLRH